MPVGVAGSLGHVISTVLGRAVGRFLAFAVTGSVLALGALATAGPAAAEQGRGVGLRQGSGISRAEILLTFVGVPALIFAICATLVYTLSGNKDARLREGKQWWSDADYYAAGGTAEGAAAVERGATTPGTQADAPGGGPAGGTSARW